MKRPNQGAAHRSGKPVDFQQLWRETHAMESALSPDQAAIALAYLVGSAQTLEQAPRAYALLEDVQAACRYAQTFFGHHKDTHERKENNHPALPAPAASLTPDAGHEPVAAALHHTALLDAAGDAGATDHQDCLRAA